MPEQQQAQGHAHGSNEKCVIRVLVVERKDVKQGRDRISHVVRAVGKAELEGSHDDQRREDVANRLVCLLVEVVESSVIDTGEISDGSVKILAPTVVNYDLALGPLG